MLTGPFVLVNRLTVDDPYQTAGDNVCVNPDLHLIVLPAASIRAHQGTFI
jgi:hypothetical protein